LICALLVLLPAIAALPQAGLARSVVPTPLEVLERRFLDENGDGRLDLWLAVRDEDGARWLQVFRQRDGRVFPAEPDERIAVPRAVTAWSLGRFSPGEAAEVLFFARDAAMARSRIDGALRLLARAPMLLDMASEELLPYWNYLADLDGDGLDEVLLICVDGYRIVDAAGVERGFIPLTPLTERVPAAARDYLGGRVRASLSSRELSDVFVPNDDAGVIGEPPILFTSTRLAAPVWADVDGDGRLDLSWYESDALHLHLQAANGRFPTEPSGRLTLPAAADSDNVRLEWTAFGGSRAADLLFVRKSGGGAVSLSSDWQVRIWIDPFARAAAAEQPALLGEPDAFVKTSAAYAGAYVVDLDGDGTRDLALSSWQVDVGLLGDAATKIRQTASGWLQSDAKLSSRPAFAETREFTLADVDSLRDVPAFAQNLTGDGRAAFLASTKGGNVEIRPLAPTGGTWAPSPKPAFRIPVDAATASLDVLDLNADGVGDFVVARSGIIEIYLSQLR